MVVAAPLLIPFATLVGIPIAGLGAIEIGKKVQDFVDNNPEKSNKILTSIKESALMTLPGSTGLNTLFKKKAKPVEEEVKETEEVNIGSGVEEKIKEILVGEGVDLGEIDLEELSKDLQAKVMSGIAKSSTNKQKDMKEASAIIGLSGPAKETKKMADEVDNRYDGGLEEVGKAKGYDYKKFFKADGGRVGYQTGGISLGGSTSLASLQRQGYRPQATTEDYANALNRVSAGTTYQQQAQAKDYARNEASLMLDRARRGSPQARGIENIYNTFFKNKNVTQISPNTFGRSGGGTDPNALMYYRSADRDKILDAMSEQMLDTTTYSQPKVNERREKEFGNYMNNLISSTYGKGDDYKAEAMTLNMPTSAYFDYLTTSDPKDVLNSYDTLSRDPNFDPKTYVATDYNNPKTPRPPSPYETYFQRELQNQTSAGIPEAQRIQQGQVMGLPTVLTGPPQSGAMQNPGYMKYEDSLAQNRALLGLKDGGRVGYNLGGLTEQGQRLRDSMSSYGFNEMEIASALDEQQLYPESMTLGMKEEVVTPGKVKSIIPTSDGEGGGGITNITNSNPNFDYETAAFNLNDLTAAEKGITEEEQKTLNFQKGKDGLMSFAKGLGFALNPLSFFAKKGYELYKNKVRDSQYREEERLRMEEFQKQKALSLAEEARVANEREVLNNYFGGSGAGPNNNRYDGADTFEDYAAEPTAYSGSSKDGGVMGYGGKSGTPRYAQFKDGGLATMFVRRR